MISENELLERFEGERRVSDGWMVLCPAHADRNPSLHITRADDRWLLKCHAGCEFASVIAEAGIDAKDLFEEERTRPSEITAAYDYVDEGGELLFQAVRFSPKDFRQRTPDGNGGWDWKLGKTRRVLYRLPRLIEAIRTGTTIYVVEGEKDVHAIEAAGGIATCNPMGAGKWHQHYRETLAGADVVIVADRDQAGRDHAEAIAKSLRGKAKSVRVVEPADGKDAADHLAAGHALDAFIEGGADLPDGAALLDEIRDFIRSYVVLPLVDENDAVIGNLLALWVLHTWTFEASWASPYLRIVSAAPESAKTLLLEVLAGVCRAGWHAINPSVAVLYRKVAAHRPTLLLDEMDNWQLDDRRDALAILNAGYKRGAKVPRCNEKGDLQEFEVFCPKAYAGLDDRALIPTLLSRSITIRMETKRPSDQVEMWIAPDVEPMADEIRSRCHAWAEHNLDALRDRRPDLLDLVNRKAEVWWALLAIGEHVGGGWQNRGREAARVLGAGGDETDAPSPQVQLLTDIRAAFGNARTIFTETLLGYLNGLEESPWGARRKGEGLDARGLARMLRPFKVKPKQVRIGDETAKGYHVDQFEDAFSRHLPDRPDPPSRGETNETWETLASHSHADVSDVSPTEGGGGGCISHPDGPDPSCHYCRDLQDPGDG